jgi:hypothetical protein
VTIATARTSPLRLSMPKTRTKKVLPFPERAPQPAPAGQTITCQIGSERFRLHIQVEDLPPVRPAIPMGNQK